jgi:hypothetical protein
MAEGCGKRKIPVPIMVLRRLMALTVKDANVVGSSMGRASSCFCRGSRAMVCFSVEDDALGELGGVVFIINSGALRVWLVTNG